MNTSEFNGAGFNDLWGDEVEAAFRNLPAAIILQTLIVPGAKVTDGILVEAVAIPWRWLVHLAKTQPNFLFELDWRKLEELVAASYREAGYQVILTPRSGDHGRDVIATREDFLSIRIIDSVKARKPGHLVEAEDIRALSGVLAADRNASKGVVTTTSDFAPRIADDPSIKPFMPYRLELINGPKLIERIISLGRGPSG